MIVNFGATSVHVLAIVNGKVDFASVRRLNIGGNNSFELFGRSLLLKSPQLKEKLTYGFLRNIYERFTAVAIDYRAQMNYFESKFRLPRKDIYRNRI